MAKEIVRRRGAAPSLEFVGRQDILENIAVRVLSHSQSCLLIGTRLVGKTSLLKHVLETGLELERGGAEECLVVYIDAGEWLLIENRSASFWAQVLRRVRDADSRNHILVDDSIHPFQQLALLNSETDQPIVLLVDNIDEYVKVADLADLRRLRRLTQREIRRRVVFVATCAEHPDTIIERRFSIDESVFTNYDVKYLQPLTNEESRDLIASYRGNLDDAEMNFVIEASGGHPELTKIALGYLLDARASKARPLNDEELEDLLFKLLIDDRVVWLCRVMVQSLRPSQKQVLLAISEGLAKTLDSVEVEQRLTQIDPQETVRRKLLEHYGYLKENTAGHVPFSRLFRAVLMNEAAKAATSFEALSLKQENHGLPVAQRAPSFSYDSNAAIVEIDGEVKSLSQLENRLLRYMIGNPGRVLSAEELLENVWPEGRTLSVVERGVNRLREKVEVNPSIPQRILTFRGEGYACVVPNGKKDLRHP